MPKSSGHRFLPTSQERGRFSFTLVEVLVACAILSLLLVILFSVLGQGSRVWQRTSGLKDNRQAARILLSLMGSDLENTVFPLVASTTTGLRFQLDPSSVSSTYLNPDAAFWQAARSGSDSANGDVVDVGYFVQWITDPAGQDHGTLCRFTIPPTSSDSIFQSQVLNDALLMKYAPGLSDPTPGSPTAYKGMIADNVLGLWIALYDRSMNLLPSPYDSRTAAARPAYADISVVLLDPIIAQRITAGNLGAMVTHAYTISSVTNAATFMAQLPAAIASGAQAFQTRVQIHAGN